MGRNADGGDGELKLSGETCGVGVLRLIKEMVGGDTTDPRRLSDGVEHGVSEGTGDTSPLLVV